MHCVQCNQFIRGRSDKKFCSIQCKNQFHRNLKTQNQSTIQQIDQILHRNHAICSELMRNEKGQKQMFPKLLLEKMGFNFNYFTGSYFNTQKKVYHYIYDYSWMEFSNRDVLIIRQSKRKIKDIPDFPD